LKKFFLISLLALGSSQVVLCFGQTFKIKKADSCDYKILLQGTWRCDSVGWSDNHSVFNYFTHYSQKGNIYSFDNGTGFRQSHIHSDKNHRAMNVCTDPIKYWFSNHTSWYKFDTNTTGIPGDVGCGSCLIIHYYSTEMCEKVDFDNEADQYHIESLSENRLVLSYIESPGGEYKYIYYKVISEGK
jgi:hypothetical protein